MYERYYGLIDRPFDLTPNPRYLLLTATHQEALSNLEYGITARKGITLLLGEAGTGKTTLLRKALGVRSRFAEESLAGAEATGRVYVNNPTLSRDEFFEVLADGFGLGGGLSKPRLLRHLDGALRRLHAQGAPAALVIDEAQSLPDEILEEIRLLANIESDTVKLLPLVLAGQPELGDRLNEPGLRQLKQRVVLRCQLTPLTLQETAAYIATRIRLAGGDAARLFTRDAVLAVYEASRGIPRTISVICDNALLAGFADDERPVGARTVDDVCRDLDLREQDRKQAPSSLGPRPFAARARLAFAGTRHTEDAVR